MSLSPFSLSLLLSLSHPLLSHTHSLAGLVTSRISALSRGCPPPPPWAPSCPRPISSLPEAPSLAPRHHCPLSISSSSLSPLPLLSPLSSLPSFALADGGGPGRGHHADRLHRRHARPRHQDRPSPMKPPRRTKLPTQIEWRGHISSLSSACSPSASRPSSAHEAAPPRTTPPDPTTKPPDKAQRPRRGLAALGRAATQGPRPHATSGLHVPGGGCGGPFLKLFFGVFEGNGSSQSESEGRGHPPFMS